MLASIYHNQYFTNHGPLAREFENQLESFLDVDHVVTVGNGSLALLIALAGLELSGEIIVPAMNSGISAQISSWLGCEVVFCDVSPTTHQPSLCEVNSVRTENTAGVLLAESWGSRCDQELIEELVDLGLIVVIIGFDSFAAQSRGRYTTDHPNVVTLFCFENDGIPNTLQGGAIVTQNEMYAEKFRNIRSSYGAREKVDVLATCNGRFSEFQAGIGLKSLSKVDEIIRYRKAIAEIYMSILSDSITVDVFDFPHTDRRNYQCFPIRLNLDEQFAQSIGSRYQNIRRGELVPHHLDRNGFPVSANLSRSTFLLPTTCCTTPDKAKSLAKDLLVIADNSAEFKRNKP